MGDYQWLRYDDVLRLEPLVVAIAQGNRGVGERCL
jgi:hypothetical protein